MNSKPVLIKSQLDQKHPQKRVLAESPASIETVNSSASSERLLAEELNKLAGDAEFPDLKLSERRNLITQWRARDRRCMRVSKYRFFQHTNYVAEWRVSSGGSVSILAHGTIRRRQMRERELLHHARVPPSANPDFKDGPDVENTNHILSMNPEDIWEAELECGGGSSFFIMPRMVLLAHERLSGM